MLTESSCFVCYCLFFLNDTATTEIYTYCHTLSLHDALPICFLTVPNIYMDKIAVGPGLPAQVVDLDASPKENLDNLAKAKGVAVGDLVRSEEHTSELQSLMRISYAVFCLKKKTTHIT